MAHGPQQFDEFRASELYCPRCRVLRPVRQRLLLVLPSGELHEYRCTVCSEGLATREVTAPPAPVPVHPRRKRR